jgi:broad specificity phosphatase PhoE
MIMNGFNGLENWKSLNDRVFAFLTEKREENIIAVTHHDPVKVAIAHAIGLLDEISAWGITISNASLSIINKESKYRVIAFALPPLDCMLKEAISRIPRRN